jgi:Holliday junction resolvasome RuvABC endonuclease subunit
MSRLLSIDPGVHHAGVALWVGGELVEARRFEDLTGAPRAILILIIQEFQYDEVAIEMPRTYGGRSSKGDTDDLLELAYCVGELREGLSAAGRFPVTRYRPNEWKGQLTKEITQERCKRILHLDELGRIVLPKDRKKQTEVWDAIGIGLCHQRREWRRH